MSEGPGYYERQPRGEQPPYGRGRENEGGDATFADVFNGFTFGSKRGRSDHGERRSAGPARPDHSGEQGGADAPWSGYPSESEEDNTPAASIRPYAWTGGRTKSNVELELETLVSTSEHYQPGMPLRHEHQSVAELCQHPRSAAEVGALLGVPFGVVKVLLADMAGQGLIHVHQTVTDSGSAPHLMLMERVLSGLRRL
ncbi:DUF742 domain-containing protein [Haloactinomyces albus]|uniref:DUF742 domain-containing protein n=1 Tax=Haloactinomyces albus TaxID=1352928 RepID=A0AAE4CM17_9ACTN|nr:DUF742 domain-containing protein [Haloactinomyces albus]MDR7302424.1 hypothetical protein [Haloactinomyces albus]